MRNDRMWKRSKMGIIFIGIIIILLSGTRMVGAAKVASVTQRGVTFYFDKAYDVGTFVNGDYWVLAPVTITSITPAYSSGENGCEVNPIGAVGTSAGDPTGQGFYSGASYFNSSLNISLPYKATTTQSIVKTKYSPRTDQTNYNSYISTAVVLTVLTSIPPNNGATVFRPPWIGTSKPLYNTGDVRFNRLPSNLAVLSGAPTLAAVASNFTPVWFDFHARNLRSKDAMYDYGPSNTPKTNEAMLRLMLNDRLTDPDWNEAFCNFTQYAIDTAHAVYNGYRKVTGHNPGYPSIAAWATTLLEGYGDMSSIKAYLQNVTDFTDFSYTGDSTNIIDGKTLWGQNSTESAYWNYVRDGTGNRSIKDPYGYIDGGSCGTDYQYINSQAYKGNILVAKLMTDMEESLHPTSWNRLKNYVERWVSFGTWASPDPCAPVGTLANYGKTYGPNGAGGCIQGWGRFPNKHGSSKDGGQYRSAFVAAMWNAYKGNIKPAEVNPLSPPQNVKIQ